MRVTCPAHIINLHLIIPNIVAKSKFITLLICSFLQLPTISSFLGQYSPPRPIFRYLLSVFFLQCERPSFTPVQNNRQNHSFVYYHFYIFRQQARRLKVLIWMAGSITRIQSPLNFLITTFWFVAVVSKYLNYVKFSNHLLAICTL
jgi:hypothetical protein